MPKKKIKILSIASCINKLNDNKKTSVLNEYVYNRHQTIIKSKLFDLEIIDTSKYFEKNLENKILNSLKKKKNLIHIEINNPLKKETYGSTLGINFLKFIKKNYKIKLIFIWGDSAIPLFKENIELASDFADLNIITASFYIKKYFVNKQNMIYLWDPIDDNFHYRKEKKNIDLLYIGQFKKNRLKFINCIKNDFDLKKFNIQLINKDDFYTSYKKYFSLFKRSKIILSFAETFGKISVTNARAFQATLSNCLLLEQAGIMTSRFFIPYKDYVPYFSKKDLLKKIKFFLEHEKKRAKISFSAFSKSKKIYNSNNYWLQILNKIKIQNNKKKLYLTKITKNFMEKKNYEKFKFNEKIYLLKEKFFGFVLNLIYYNYKIIKKFI